MNSKIIIPILAVVALGLAVLAFVNHKAISDKNHEIVVYSNNVVQTQTKLDEMTGVANTAKADLEKKNADYLSLSNTHASALTTLAKTETDLKQTEDALKISKETLAARDAKITELENQNKELDAKAAEYSTAITNLNTQIAVTQQKLASAEGDKALLQKELTKLLAEKAELEKKLNDLKFLKQQVAQLKAELSIANRLRWLREGLFGPGEKKGAQQLMDKSQPAAPTNSYDLNVEIHSDGTTTPLAPVPNK
ncbi:MAG: hypothetical protein RLY20_2857 [Verrucomicrobiota bacterium]|jgi:chromosome segregation ATPase